MDDEFEDFSVSSPFEALVADIQEVQAIRLQLLGFTHAFDSHHLMQALRKWPLLPSSRSDDMKVPLTEHPVSLYGAVDVGEGQNWRLLWFNVSTPLTVTTMMLNTTTRAFPHHMHCPHLPLIRPFRFTPTLRCPPPAPLCPRFDRGHTVQATPSGPPSGSSLLFA